MLPDAFPQLIETLLRLPHLEATQLRELIEHLPDPQASAREMVRRGWITPDQFSSLFSGPQQRPTAQETLLVGFGDAAVPPDADCENWDLTVSDEEDKADAAPEVECARPDRTDEEMLPEPETVEAVPVPSGAGSTPQFEWDMLVPAGVAGNEARARESATDKRLRQWKGWATKGLLLWILFQGSFFAGRQFFGTARAVPPVARQQAAKGKKKTRVPTDQRRVASRPMMVAKANKAPNNQVAADNPARAADLPAQPAAAPPQGMLPAQEAPQQGPASADPAVWNGPFMFPAQAPQQFRTPRNLHQAPAYQQRVRQQMQRHQQMMQRQQQMMQRRLHQNLRAQQ